MNLSTAKILNSNPTAAYVTASAARISTQQGTALQIYERSGNCQKDLSLIRKVLSSGHKSVIEHQTLSIAFNDVSVFAEQYVIEFRLASFTVKSRRYVDFSEAGFVIPDSLTDGQKEMFRARMESLFKDYTTLMEMGIPKEDARFLLPYCLRSNFFMTINARELMQMICSMIKGRGARFEEIKSLGNQLKAQFDKLYPEILDAELTHYCAPAEETFPKYILEGSDVMGHAELISGTSDPEALLECEMAFSNRFEPCGGHYFCEENMRKLLNDNRPRELESLHYTFRIHNISLACLTHFTRHRMLSPLIPCVIRALYDGNYVLPASVTANPDAERIYRNAFRTQAEAAQKAIDCGMAPESVTYYAMSGHVLDILLSMNARELLHFSKLRTCSRAQWEIQGVARDMLLKLNETAPDIFGGFGPSCAVIGHCPEGKMSCGHPVRIVRGEWKYLK